MSRKPIDGTKNLYVDKEGYIVDENFIKVPTYKNEDGHKCVKVSGEEREVRKLVFTHFANKGEGAEVQKGKAPRYKDGDKENCDFDNLVIAKSEEEQTKEVIEKANPEDEVEQQIIELFVEDNDATYDDITERMKERHDEKVTRNQIADAKKSWKFALKEAGQI